jgi:drug/metabolite transporter (DMT)-like permease
VLFLAEAAGLLPVFVIALLSGEAFPPASVLLWSGAASLLGVTGLLILYRALASGRMTIAAPVSALLAAVIPVPVSALAEGLPGATAFLGFGLAFAAVWTISQDGTTRDWRFNLSELRLPLAAGVFFGLYFVLFHHATQEAFLWPLINARLVGALAILAYALALRQPVLPDRSVWGLASLGGMLDVGGNAFYALAGQAGRLDVAAVIGSLYPGATVVLATMLLRERISRMQALGILAALAAIVLLAL